jgi:ribonuclease HI
MGGRSPALAELGLIIEEHKPSILCLTETPLAEHCKPLRYFLKSVGYAIHFQATKAAPHTPSEDFEAPHCHHAAGGVLIAVSHSAGIKHSYRSIHLPKKALLANIAGILIKPLLGRKRLIIAAYLPHSMADYSRVLEFIASLPGLPQYADTDILLAGDFQAPWAPTTPKGSRLTSALTPAYARIPYPIDPTFEPYSQPAVHTTIDHFATTPNDPWAAMPPSTVARIRSAYLDHHALLLTVPHSFLHLPPQSAAAPPEPRPSRLCFPIPEDRLQAWKHKEACLQEAAMHEANDILTQLHDLLSQSSPSEAQLDHHNAMLAQAAIALTSSLQASFGRAHQMLPKIAGPPPLHPRTGQPFWPKHIAKLHKACTHRCRLLRTILADLPAPPTTPSASSLEAAAPLLDALSAHLLGDRLTPALTPPAAADITVSILQDLLKTHRSLAESLKQEANNIRNANWKKYLTSLVDNKTKKALQVIKAIGSNSAPSASLRVLRTTEGTLVSDPPEVIAEIHKQATASLTNTVPPASAQDAYPWELPDAPDSFHLEKRSTDDADLLSSLDRGLYDRTLHKIPSHKAPGIDDIPTDILKHQPPSFHDNLFLLFRCMLMLGCTPDLWVRSITILLYKKGDPTVLDNYRPIGLAISLYKLWTGVLAEAASQYAETAGILSNSQEGFRKGRSCARAIATIQFTLEDAAAHSAECWLAYLDFKGAFPSVDHLQLKRILTDLGMPADFVKVVGNLYAQATTSFLSPYGPTEPIPICRGTLQGDPLSPFLFDCMIEPLLRWIQAGNNGYIARSIHQALTSVAYADDLTLVCATMAMLQLQLDKVDLFSKWSHIRTNVPKSLSTVYSPDLQHLSKKKRMTSQHDLLCNLRLSDQPLPSISEHESPPDGFLGVLITASLNFALQRKHAHSTYSHNCWALAQTPLDPPHKLKALESLTNSAFRHTFSAAPYTAVDIAALDAKKNACIRLAKGLPKHAATASIQGPRNEACQGKPSLMVDYANAATTAAIEFLNDPGYLGCIARASTTRAQQLYEHWPLALALETNGSTIARLLALPAAANLHVMLSPRNTTEAPALPFPQSFALVGLGAHPFNTHIPPLWKGNPISDFISSVILPHPDALPLDEPAFPPHLYVLRKLAPIWAHGIYRWDTLICSSKPRGRPSANAPTPSLLLRTHAQLLRANPSLPTSGTLPAAITFLHALLTSTDMKHFKRIKEHQRGQTALPPSIVAQRWLLPSLLEQLPAAPSPTEPAPQPQLAQRTIKAFTIEFADTLTPASVLQTGLRPAVPPAATHTIVGKRPKGSSFRRTHPKWVSNLPPSDKDVYMDEARIKHITAKRTYEDPHVEGPLIVYIQELQVEWATETIPWCTYQQAKEAGFKPVGKPKILNEFRQYEEFSDTPCAICKEPDAHLPDVSDQVGCFRCLGWFHRACLPTGAVPPLQEYEQLPYWVCPNCAPPSTRNPLPCQLCTVRWKDSWQSYGAVLSINGGPDALQRFRHKRQWPIETVPADDGTPAHLLETPLWPIYAAKRQRRRDAEAAAVLPPTPPPAPPAPLRLSANTVICFTEINPVRDAPPTSQHCAYRVTLPSDPASTPMIRICAPDGRAVGFRDLTLRRYYFLHAQYQLHYRPSHPPFLKAVADLLRRYSPKSKLYNPQGNQFNIKNNWAIQDPLMQGLKELFGTTTQLFGSPLNCSPEPGTTYYSAFPEDAIFGAIHNCMRFRWTASCQANPEYEPADMLAAMQRAIQSAHASTDPFLCILILPHWSASPYRHTSIMQDPAVQVVTTIAKGKFRFVDARYDVSDPKAVPTTNAAANWAVDIISVSNPAGFDQYVRPNLPAIQDKLPRILRDTSGVENCDITLWPDPCTDIQQARARKPPQPKPMPDLPPSSPCTPVPHSPSFRMPDLPATHLTPVYSDAWPLEPCLRSISLFKRPSDDDYRPIRVGEMCGGIASFLESLLNKGHSIALYIWMDINPHAHAAVQDRLEELHAKFPEQLPRSAFAQWDTTLPYDCTKISPDLILYACPEGLDIVAAGPPCQPYSDAGFGKGLNDRRSLALLAVARIITFLHHTQGNLAFMIENVKGTEKFPELTEMLGEGVLLDAPPCGSNASREIVLWQNLRPAAFLRKAFHDIRPRRPPTTVNALLQANGIHDWTTQRLTLGKHTTNFEYNIAGRDLYVLPKFVCYYKSHQYKEGRGKVSPLGLMWHNNKLDVPIPEIKELCMGYSKGTTAHSGLTERQRHHLLGQVYDPNQMGWAINVLWPAPPLPHTPRAAPTAPHRPWTDLQAGPSLANSLPHPTRPVPPLPDDLSAPPAPPPAMEYTTPESLLAALPEFVAHWEAEEFTYTDGSRQEGNPVLGAAVVHAPTDTVTYIDASGYEENNTINRAELVAIHQALLLHRNTQHLRILTDSLCSLQKIAATISAPRTRMRDSHLELLCHIVGLIQERDTAGRTTALRKVAAHAGIPHNERADMAAKAVRDGAVPPTHTVITHRVGAQPHRLPYWAFFQPPAPADAPQDAPPPAMQALTNLSLLSRHTRPALREATARPSLYRTLMKSGITRDGLRIHQAAACIHAYTASGQHSHARTLTKYLWGQLYNGKLAHRYGHADNDLCPLRCGLSDSCTHIGGGCPKLKGSYIDRHNHACRIISNWAINSAIGGSFLYSNLTLQSEDSGKKQLLADPNHAAIVEHIAAKVEAWEQRLSNEGLNPRTNTRTEDVTIDMADVRAALHRLFEDMPESRTPPCHIPDRILPRAIEQRLRRQGKGTCPDIVFADGLPDKALSQKQLKKIRKQSNVLVLEIACAADLRLPEKEQQKIDYYEPLMVELRKIWGTATLIVIPIGCGGSMLQRTLDHLATAFAANPAKPANKEAKALAASLSAMVTSRLVGIVHLRATKIAELPEDTPETAAPSTPPPQRRAVPPSTTTRRPQRARPPSAHPPGAGPPSRPPKPPRPRP